MSPKTAKTHVHMPSVHVRRADGSGLDIDIRAYVDIDDRIAAAVAFQSAEQAQKGYERTVRALRQGIDPKSSTGKTARRK